MCGSQGLLSQACCADLKRRESPANVHFLRKCKFPLQKGTLCPVFRVFPCICLFSKYLKVYWANTDVALSSTYTRNQQAWWSQQPSRLPHKWGTTGPSIGLCLSIWALSLWQLPLPLILQTLTDPSFCLCSHCIPPPASSPTPFQPESPTGGCILLWDPVLPGTSVCELPPPCPNLKRLILHCCSERLLSHLRLKHQRLL